MFTKLIRPIKRTQIRFYSDHPKNKTISKIREFINPTECRLRTPVTKFEKNICIGAGAICATLTSGIVYKIANPILQATCVVAVGGGVFIVVEEIRDTSFTEFFTELLTTVGLCLIGMPCILAIVIPIFVSICTLSEYFPQMVPIILFVLKWVR